MYIHRRRGLLQTTIYVVTLTRRTAEQSSDRSMLCEPADQSAGTNCAVILEYDVLRRERYYVPSSRINLRSYFNFTF